MSCFTDEISVLIGLRDPTIYCVHLFFRSGKIMRRILRKIAAGETSPEKLGDISTLADPSVVKSLVKARESLK